MGEVTKLQERLAQRPVARQRFISDILNALARQGVDVENPEVLKQLGIDETLQPIVRDKDNVASSVAVTIIY